MLTSHICVDALYLTRLHGGRHLSTRSPVPAAGGGVHGRAHQGPALPHRTYILLRTR